jgi:hypothetical protein
MPINKQKLLNVLSGIWLLISFLLTSAYKDNAYIEGLFISIFWLGIFMSPIWTIHAWKYLTSDKMPIKFFYTIIASYSVWIFYEIAKPYHNNPQFALLTMIGFIVIQYFVDTYPQKTRSIKYFFTFINSIKTNWKKCLQIGLPLLLVISIYQHFANIERTKKLAEEYDRTAKEMYGNTTGTQNGNVKEYH